MAHAQKPDFVFRAKRTIPFKSAGGRQFSRLLAAEVCASAVVMLGTPCSEVVWRVLATHCIRQFPPSLPLPCVTVCHHISTGVYLTESYNMVKKKLIFIIWAVDKISMAGGGGGWGRVLALRNREPQFMQAKCNCKCVIEFTFPTDWYIHTHLYNFLMQLDCICTSKWLIKCYSIAGPSGARSKARVCGRSPAEIVGSNLTGRGMGAWIAVCCEWYVLPEVSASSSSLVQRSLTDCDESLCVIWKPQECGRHGPCWAAAPQEKRS